MKPITDIEQRVFDELCAYYDAHGWMPQIRELGERVGIAYSGIPAYLDRLAKRGYIVRGRGSSPRIVITRFED